MKLLPWIDSFHSNPQATLRLFCFPYAGGSAAIYRLWHLKLPSNVEICPVELPGRGRRLGEKPLERLDLLVESLGEVLVPICREKPFAFFGHSLGGLLAFEFSRLLRNRHHLDPHLLCISGYGPPHRLAADRPRYHDWPEDRFLEKIKKMSGTPTEVLRNKEVMGLFLPILRADLALADFYEYVPQAPLDCPIFVMGGEGDEEVNPAFLNEWELETSAHFRMQLFQGNHFFLHSAAPSLLRELSLALQKVQEIQPSFR